MSISLLGSINVCKVNTGWADKIQSDRFENPNNMLCPLWNGQDTYGRFVSPDSFYTKTPGCASAADRVMVENFQRPQYIDYVALDAAGFRAPLYAGYPPNGFIEGYQNGTKQLSGVTEHYALSTGQAPASQFTRDENCTLQDALSINMITGRGGQTDFRKTNTLTDKGFNGVAGGYPTNSMGYPMQTGGCGQWYNGCPATLTTEMYTPDHLSAVNANQRQALSGIQNFKSDMTQNWSGMATRQ